VVDPVPSRRELALKLGATDVIDPLAESPATRISAAGGADVSLDTSGVPASVEAAIQCLTRDGSCGLVSSGRPGATITLPIGQISMGRKIVGVLEGDSNPQTFIPELVDLHLQGRFPFDQMLRFYDFDDINQAAADSHAGVAIKPIIRMPQGRGQA
jgi:aryl-alcohol dehydrogenase